MYPYQHVPLHVLTAVNFEAKLIQRQRCVVAIISYTSRCRPTATFQHVWLHFEMKQKMRESHETGGFVGMNELHSTCKLLHATVG